MQNVGKGTYNNKNSFNPGGNKMNGGNQGNYNNNYQGQGNYGSHQGGFGKKFGDHNSQTYNNPSIKPNNSNSNSFPKSDDFQSQFCRNFHFG
jgi:hypothetical protein